MPAHRRKLILNAAEAHVIVIETPSQRRKLCQIRFSNSDGSLFLSLPYFQPSQGLATIAVCRTHSGGHPSVDLRTHGAVTAHHVKYSHHPSGMARLSQTERVKPLSKQSVAFAQLSGPLFVIRLQGLSAFKPLEASDLPRPSVLSATFPSDYDAFQIVGSLYPRTHVLARSEKEVLGPVA